MEKEDERIINNLKDYEISCFIELAAHMPIEKKGKLVEMLKKYKKLDATVEYQTASEKLIIKLKKPDDKNE